MGYMTSRLVEVTLGLSGLLSGTSRPQAKDFFQRGGVGGAHYYHYYYFFKRGGKRGDVYYNEKPVMHLQWGKGRSS